jgi:Family of unknown function (DUF5681)
MTKQFGAPRWEPGQSGNPKGRPKMTRKDRIGKLMDAMLRDKLKEKDGYLAEVLATRLLQLARQGSLKAIELIMERTEGKPQQSLNLNTNETPTVTDIDERIQELLGRAAARKDDGGGENATPRTPGDSGEDTRVQ